MTPQPDHLMRELHQLREEVADLRRARRSRSLLAGAALAALVWWVQPLPLGAQGGAISGCIVDATRMLRIAPTCVAGETRLTLMTGSESDGKTPGPKPSDPGKSPAAPMRVTAPFEVVDTAGVTIMRVTARTEGGQRGIRLHNAQGNQVVAINNLDDGGLVKVMLNGTDKEAASLVAMGSGPRLTLRINDNERAGIGPTAAGRLALWVNNEGGKQVAALGESPVVEGAGAFRLMNQTGLAAVSADALPSGGAVNVFGASRNVPSAAMTTESDGRGVVAAYNASGQAAAAITESGNFRGAGRIYVNDPGGGWVFAAGLTDTGGNACVNRKTGTWCTGVNIPLGIGASPK